jgi:hypothetical protein
MRRISQRLLPCLPALLIFISGCETYPQQQGPGLGQLLFPSFRTMPEQEWSFQQDYERKLAEVEQLRAENQQLRQLLNPPATHQALPSRPGPDLSPLPPPGVKEVEVDSLPGSTLPADPLPSLGEPEGVPLEPLSSPTTAVQLGFNQHQTRLVEANQFQNGKLVLAIEPRDASGQIVRGPASLTLVVSDPALSGEQARLARWELGEKEVERWIEKSTDGEAIQIDLPFSSPLPAVSRLHILARYQQPGGRVIESQMDLPMQDDELAGEWSPRRQGSLSPTGIPRVANPLPAGQIPLPLDPARDDAPFDDGWQR